MTITIQNVRRVALICGVMAIVCFIPLTILYYASPDYDYMLIILFVFGVAPPSILSIIHDRWKNKIQKAMPEFLRDVATSLRTGVTIHAALEHASRRNYGPLTREIKIMVSQMGWGMTFEKALEELMRRVSLPLVDQASTLMLEAGRYGGDLSEVFDYTARYMESVNTWNMRRRTQTLPYVAIFYFSVVLFLFIIIVVSKMIFIPLSESQVGTLPFLKPILTPLQSRRVFLHASLLESLFGGMVSGKINEDSYMSGLKHAMVLAIISGLAFYSFFR